MFSLGEANCFLCLSSDVYKRQTVEKDLLEMKDRKKKTRGKSVLEGVGVRMMFYNKQLEVDRIEKVTK